VDRAATERKVVVKLTEVAADRGIVLPPPSRHSMICTPRPGRQVRESTVYMERRRYGGIAVIKLVGRLDGASSQRVRTALGRLIPPNGRALLDLTKTSYLSSAGLRALLLSCRKAEALGTAIALGGLPAEVRGIMAAAGFLDLFTVADSVADGIDILSRVSVGASSPENRSSRWVRVTGGERVGRRAGVGAAAPPE
jgi:anti-anti-sigma factor